MDTADLAGALWLPDDGKANPTDLTYALARGARNAGRDDPAADPGHRHPDPTGGAVTGVRTDRGRHRGRDRHQLRRAVGQAGRRLVRGDRAAALLRALLRGHRADRRGAPGPAGAPRPGRLHLLQGGSRRAGGRRLRAGRQAVGVPRGHPAAVRVPAAGRGLGALRAADGAGPAAHPGAARGGHQEVLQRPGELHPGQPVHPGPGGRAAELLGRRRLQLGRHRVRGRRGPGAGPVDPPGDPGWT